MPGVRDCYGSREAATMKAPQVDDAHLHSVGYRPAIELQGHPAVLSAMQTQSGGVQVTLKEGVTFDGAHYFWATTVKRAQAKLRRVKPCSCVQCIKKRVAAKLRGTLC